MRISRWIVVALLLVAGVAGAPQSANAADGAVLSLDVPGPYVTEEPLNASGILTRTGGSGTSAAEPVADAEVVISYIATSGGIFEQARGRTDGSGRYAVTVPGSWAYFRENSATLVASSYVDGLPVTSRKITFTSVVRTFFRMIVEPTGPVASGSMLTFVGSVSWSGGMRSGALDHQPVTLEFSADGRTWKPADRGLLGGYDATDRFWLEAKATASGYWRVAFAGNAYTLPSRSPLRRVEIRDGTRTILSTRTSKAAHTVSFTGRLTVKKGRSWVAPGIRTVSIRSLRRGTTKAVELTRVRTKRDGSFAGKIKTRVTGSLIARFTGAGVQLPSEARRWVEMRAKASVRSEKVAPSTVKGGSPVIYSGRLLSCDTAGKCAKALAKRTLRIMFLDADRSTPVHVGTVTTDASGRFRFRTRASATGEFSAVFAADATHLGTTSRGAFLAVTGNARKDRGR
ncbi:hypothetical protein GCM10027589_36660 [Actinocorallia lasiicapitis]